MWLMLCYTLEGTIYEQTVKIELYICEIKCNFW
jgi:hypothetical protein